jgi:subtilisin family serine protease
MSGTGRGLKIAVIDSGVNLRHPHIVARTRRVVFTPDEHGEDLLGHGTAVMAAIQEKAPDAEYWALKIFSRTLRARSTRLTAAFEWAIANRMDIVNLSLGTPNLEARETLQSLVDRANAAGTLVISACANKYRMVLPGSLDGVLGVELDADLPRDSYRISSPGLRLRASGNPRPLPGMPVEDNLNGVSFAVANITGFAARVCEDLELRSPAALYNALCAAL